VADDEDQREGPSRWWEFEQFVREILAATPGIWLPESAGALFSTSARKDLGFDIEAMRRARPLLVEIVSQTPQTASRLVAVLDQLRAAADAYVKAAGPAQRRQARPSLLAVFPGVISPQKLVFSSHLDVEIWDGRYLTRQARQLGIRVPSFIATPDNDEVGDRVPAHDLELRLDAIAPGREHAVTYEKWCKDVLEFLFCPPLSPPILQSSNGSGASRRDLILPNYSTRGFWHFMNNHYEAAAVVAEAKNYGTKLDKPAVLQLANYLSRHGTGLFGMLLTRKGLNEGADWTRREHWVLHDKMMIGLDDEDMRQMLLTKAAGGNPADLIQQRIEDFRLRI
jgi:hypothetical protein